MKYQSVMEKVVTFGEVMLRLSPPGNLRIRQAPSLEILFGGAEANVAVALAQWGFESAFVSRLPAENEVAESCLAQMRGLGVDVSGVIRGGDRMGIYFVERGAAQRPYTVLYDRANSAISSLDPSALDWDALLDGATAFHTTGITLALSDNAAKAAADGMKAAKAKGLTVSFDPNYRAKLWSEEKASAVLTPLMDYVTLLFAAPGDAKKLFGVTPSTQAEGIESATEVAIKLSEKFPSAQTVAMQLRSSESASGGGWTGLVYRSGETAIARSYTLDNTVDRIGTGDAFAAGLLFRLLSGGTLQEAVEMATAAGCLKHLVNGDFLLASLAEVEELAGGGHGGRVKR